MNGKKLKYEFTVEESNQLLQMVNRVQIVGVQSAKAMLTLVEKLQNPVNATELEKEQLEALKAKHEPKKETKK